MTQCKYYETCGMKKILIQGKGSRTYIEPLSPEFQDYYCENLESSPVCAHYQLLEIVDGVPQQTSQTLLQRRLDGLLF